MESLRKIASPTFHQILLHTTTMDRGLSTHSIHGILCPLLPPLLHPTPTLPFLISSLTPFPHPSLSPLLIIPIPSRSSSLPSLPSHPCPPLPSHPCPQCFSLPPHSPLPSLPPLSLLHSPPQSVPPPFPSSGGRTRRCFRLDDALQADGHRAWPARRWQ